MKRAAAALVFGFILGFSALSFAGSGQVTRPEPTSPIYIAMLYEKLISDRTPDFADWVRESPEFRKAELYEQPDILEKGKAKLATLGWTGVGAVWSRGGAATPAPAWGSLRHARCGWATRCGAAAALAARFLP
jgi:hypothetical protein